jgi:WhiB family redox-sensing transcriptional regulator
VTAVFEPTVIARIEQERLSLPCWAVDPDLFFAEPPAEVEAAKAICAACPVRQACLAGAVTRREPYGVWGGELVVGGTVIARKRPRGRPRKSPVPEPRPERPIAVPTAA